MNSLLEEALNVIDYNFHTILVIWEHTSSHARLSLWLKSRPSDSVLPATGLTVSGLSTPMANWGQGLSSLHAEPAIHQRGPQNPELVCSACRGQERSFGNI